MKKYVQNFWVRFLACVLCSVTLVAAIAAVICMAGVSVSGTKEEFYEMGRERIAKNYAAYIYDHLGDTENLDQVKKINETLTEYLKDKNFTCSVLEVSQSNGEIETEELFAGLKDASDWDYMVEISEDANVSYNVDSVLDTMRISPVIDNLYYMSEVAITDYVFDEESGLFYCSAATKFFLVDYITVCDEGIYYDYWAKTLENGELVYYNSYYDITLDTSNYQEWDWVQLYDVRLFVSDIQVVTTEVVQQKNYTGFYNVYDNGTMVSYYPDYLGDGYHVLIKMNEELVYDDMFYEWRNVVDALYDNVVTYQVVLVLSIITFILSFALLIYSANNDKEQLSIWCKLPVGCFSLVFLILTEGLPLGLLFLLFDRFYGYRVIPFDIFVTLATILVFVMAFAAMIWLQNIVIRFKTRTFVRHSEIYYGYRIIKWCWNKITIPFKVVLQIAREHTKLLVKGLLMMFIISIVEFFVFVFFRWNTESYLFMFVVVKAVEWFVVICVLLQMQKLQEGSKRIAAGDLSEPIDTSKMFWEFKTHGENINKVSDGIALAVEDRMKSERFKTELITNVSHDIKTPLTSIINYVDLIKKEDIQDETLQEYVEVLDRQSARLKKLIEDLMEASKASTGNLAVNVEDCDVEVLLTQLIGEFEERLSANQLQVIVEKPEHPVVVSADGRHMWRVLDNLLNNACKYSLPGTRVYVSLTQVGNEATITFKNISKAALNIPSDELMERFVRGDSSRNTEGSGLGLSIAQSLTELMKGTMRLEIDGDLFKVTLKFVAKP